MNAPNAATRIGKITAGLVPFSMMKNFFLGLVDTVIQQSLHAIGRWSKCTLGRNSDVMDVAAL